MPPSKKAKLVNQFLDLEAEVEDEEEEGDVDDEWKAADADFIKDDGSEIGEGTEDGEEPCDVDPIVDATAEHDDSEELVTYFRERARRVENDYIDPIVTTKVVEAYRDMLLDVAIRAGDSPLWQVPVKKRTEQEAVHYVLRHVAALEKQLGEPPFVVRAALSRTMAPGYIFVEAPSAQDVRRACEGFVGFQGRFKNITVVSIDQSVALLTHNPCSMGLKEDSWVRIQCGEYAGDLAYLYRLEENNSDVGRTQGSAHLAVIPRISKTSFPAERSAKADKTSSEATSADSKYGNAADNKKAGNLSSSALMKRKRYLGRPLQRFFNPLEWPEEARKLDREGLWQFRGARYGAGTLDLTVPINPLNIGVTTPSRTELQLWTTCPYELIATFAEGCLNTLSEEFWEDDRVELTNGEHLGRRGLVREVDKEFLSVLVRTDDLRAGQPERNVSSIEIKIGASFARKVFEVGDYVEAVSDQNTDLQGFVVAVDQAESMKMPAKVTVMEHGGDKEFISNSTLLHLREPPVQRYMPLSTSLSRDEQLVLRFIPRQITQNPSKRYSRLESLWNGMPVVVMHKSAKGYRGDIRSVHEKVINIDDKKDPRVQKAASATYKISSERIPHECHATCQGCSANAPTKHICSPNCYRCWLHRYEKDLTLAHIDFIVIEVYIQARNKVELFKITDVRPADEILTRDAYMVACWSKDFNDCPRVPTPDQVNWTDQTTRARWQEATIELIRFHQLFESQAFGALCEDIAYRCKQRQCDDLFDEFSGRNISACQHNIASLDDRVKTANKFGLVPFWYRDKWAFEHLCRTIIADCQARRCEIVSDKPLANDLPVCKHDTASHNARLKSQWSEIMFGLVPQWDIDPNSTQPDESAGRNPRYAPAPPRVRGDYTQPERAQTPPWGSKHKYPSSPAWNPADGVADEDPFWAIHDTKYSVDEDWLDEKLRALKTILYLVMASGPRCYSPHTEGVDAKLILSTERGNLININLLWNKNPKTLADIPICHVLPKHPTSADKGSPAVFIRGPLKAQFRLVHNVDDDQVFVSELLQKRNRIKPQLTQHSIYDLVLCQWPKGKA